MSHQVEIQHPQEGDEERFVDVMRESKSLHYPWVSPPCDSDSFAGYLKKYRQENNISYILRLGDNIVGVVNINEINQV